LRNQTQVASGKANIQLQQQYCSTIIVLQSVSLISQKVTGLQPS